MFWYLAVFAVLVLLAIVEREQRWPGISAAVILGLMCGLRYETGFDWVEYELHYLYTPGFGDTNIYTSITTFSAEPGFELLNRVLRTLRADFQWLLCVIGFFNLFILYKFIRRFSPLVVVILVWYYGFVFLTGQMATIRQALSVSFIYLAFIQNNDGNRYRAVILSVISVLFHTFSMVFVPLVFLTARPLGAKWLAIFAAIGFTGSIIGGNLFVSVADAALNFTDAGVLGERLEIYSSLAGANISPVSILIVFWHIAFVYIVFNKLKYKHMDYISRVSVWSTWLSVLFHSWFAAFPILWNRSMLITFVLQAIQLCRLYYGDFGQLYSRLRFIGVASVGSLLALLYALANEQALVYEPYQNLAVVWVRGAYGNGRLRYQIIRNENNSLIAEQKAK